MERSHGFAARGVQLKCEFEWRKLRVGYLKKDFEPPQVA
jgi:hypothetical protein